MNRRPLATAGCLALVIAGLMPARTGAQVVAGPTQAPNGHEYRVVYYPDRTLTWEEARVEAMAGGGHLATITDEREDLFIERLRQEALAAAGIDPFDSASAPSLWIGGSQAQGQAAVDAGWQWVAGEGPITAGPTGEGYLNWLPGEPNDWRTLGVEDDQENFLAIGIRGTFSWNDAGGRLRGYVAEVDVTPVRTVVGPTLGPDGHYYEVVIEAVSRSWEQASEEARCRTHGQRAGHLATITSAEEGAFIEALRQEAVVAAGFHPDVPDAHPALWVGGFQERDQSTVDAGWRWVNGEGPIGAAGYSNWRSGEPNDSPSHGVEDNQENFLTIGFRGGARWNDAGGTLIGFVVEYSEPIGFDPVRRSARYAGTGGHRFDGGGGFSLGGAMTFEAWVHRENAARREAILAKEGNAGAFKFWFGFNGPKLHFLHATTGAGGVDSTGDVPTGQWTHVAASYDGSTVRFYINGQPAGQRSLPFVPGSPGGALHIGEASGVDRFLGSLDEVRVWSAVRSQAQLAGGRFEELRGVAGLVAAFPRGDYYEALAGAFGTVPLNGSRHQRSGILPVDLVVPAAAVPPKLDGNVDPATEYAGAEEIVLRYDDGPNYRDARAYLVHTKEFLYVGVEGARLPSGGAPSLDDVLEVFLDADGGSTGFNTELVRGQQFLADGLGAFAQVERRTIENPITGGVTVLHVWAGATPPPFQFQSAEGSERVSEITTAPDLEFRFHRSLLGDFDARSLDRLALRHGDNGGPNGDAWSPDGGAIDAPGTWAEVRYHPLPAVQLPQITASGRVVREGSGEGIAGITVMLSGNSAVYETDVTDSLGRFVFGDVAVGVGETLRVRVVVPEGAEMGAASHESFGEAPLVLGAAEAVFPGCSGSFCGYAPLTFRMTLPLPSVVLTAFEPATVWPPVVTRWPLGWAEPWSAGPKTTGTPTMRVDLANAHDRLEFFLVGNHCPVDPTASDLCEEGVDYFRLESTLVVPTDGTPAHFELRLPEVDVPAERPDDPSTLPISAVPFPRGFRLAAHDTWSRPANDPRSPASWRYAAGSVAVTEPPYPLIHGFPFANKADRHDIDDYRAAFYDQACNPLTMVGFWAFAPIYLEVLGGGECLGMVVTANQFATGMPITTPTSVDYFRYRDVLFGNGFPGTGPMGQDPILPAMFDVSNPCSPAPRNVWARIRANHGVQLSSEFIGELLSHFEIIDGFLAVDLERLLDRIRPRPLDFQLCFRTGDRGHCVQPLRVIDEVRDGSGAVVPDRHAIEIWDPNRPGATRRIIVDAPPGGRGRYTYDGFSPAWSGNWMMAYEIDAIWDGQRHIPSIDTLGAALAPLDVRSITELLQLVVSGDAEPLVTSPNGDRVGWTAAGEFVEEGTATIPIPNFNWIENEIPPLGHHPMPMFHRTKLGVPELALHNRGDFYTVHASHGGAMMQMMVESRDQAPDSVRFLRRGERVDGMIFRSGTGSARGVESRIALCRDGSSYPAAITLGSMSVPGGTSLGVRLLPRGTGIELLNDTGAIVAPDFSVAVPSPQGPEPIIADAPALPVPPGASLSIASPDGTSFGDLVFDIDETRDGTPDQSFYFRSGTGTFQQIVSGAAPSLSVAFEPEATVVSWPHVEGWHLVISGDSRLWEAAKGVVVVNGTATWTGEGAPGRLFFRLDKTL